MSPSPNRRRLARAVDRRMMQDGEVGRAVARQALGPTLVRLSELVPMLLAEGGADFVQAEGEAILPGGTRVRLRFTAAVLP